MAEVNKKNVTPLFVLGSGRSGTTLLQRILNSHKEICVWGEHDGFLVHIAYAYYKFFDKRFYNNVIAPNRRGVDINAHVDKIKNPSHWPAWENWLTEDDVRKHFRNFLESFFNPAGVDASFCGFKEISYGAQDRVLDLLKDIFPDAKFIFIVRNPRDTILSQIRMFHDGDKKNFDKMARFWVLQNEEYLRFNTENPNNSLLIKYEDLVFDNDTVLNKLFSFLGLECSPQQSEMIFFNEGRGADPKPFIRYNLLSAEETIMLDEITKETALKFNYQ